MVVVMIDAVVAVALLGGAIQSSAVERSTQFSAGTWGFAAAVGALGPLALRSPIRKTRVKQKDAGVGLTYFYDVVRLYSLFAFDERLVMLKRRDVVRIRTSWISTGWTSDTVVDELKRHVDDHRGLSTDNRSRVLRQVRSAKSLLAEDDRIDGLIKIMQAERFRALLDEIGGTRPPDQSKAEAESVGMTAVEIDGNTQTTSSTLQQTSER